MATFWLILIEYSYCVRRAQHPEPPVNSWQYDGSFTQGNFFAHVYVYVLAENASDYVPQPLSPGPKLFGGWLEGNMPTVPRFINSCSPQVNVSQHRRVGDAT